MTRRCSSSHDVHGALRAGAGAARRLAHGRARARSPPCSARTAPARRRRSAPISGHGAPRGRAPLRRQRRRRNGPEAVARLGIAHVPEGRGTFAELTVWENLRLGAYTRRGRSEERLRRACCRYFPWLEDRRSQQAGTLSGGEQQMLALARAFMQRPRLLLLDEPSLGLAPLLVTEVFRIVRELNENEGVTVLVVEQNAHIALQVAQTAYVLEVGRVALSGPSAELQAGTNPCAGATSATDGRASPASSTASEHRSGAGVSFAVLARARRRVRLPRRRLASRARSSRSRPSPDWRRVRVSAASRSRSSSSTARPR